MTPNIFVYWDYDDCLGQTRKQFVQILLERYGHVVKTDDYLTPANTDGLLAPILDSAEFMRSTPLDHTVLRVMQFLCDLRPDVKHGLATHRGYHPKGAEYTQELLERNGVTFDSYHYIDPVPYRDKMKYLRELHKPEDIVILVDDNTYYDHDAYPNSITVLIDKPWNKHVVTAHPELRVTPEGVYHCLQSVLDHIEQYKGVPDGRETQCEDISRLGPSFYVVGAGVV